MKRPSISLPEFIRIVKPTYTILKLIPNYSVTNTQTDSIAKTIANLYKPIIKCIEQDHQSVLQVFGKDFLVGTHYQFHTFSKVMYYIYLEKDCASFYFVIPTEYETLLREKILSVWSTITIQTVLSLPVFKENCANFQLSYKYEDALSLNADKRHNDLLSNVLTLVNVLNESERMALVYNFMPCSQFTWQKSAHTILEQYKNGSPMLKNKLHPLAIFQAILKGGEAVFKEIEALFKTENKKHAMTFEIGHSSLKSLNDTFDKLDTSSDKMSNFTKKKEHATVIDTQIVVQSESSVQVRRLLHAKMLGSAFDCVGQDEDNQMALKRLRRDIGSYFQYRFNHVKSSKCSEAEAQNFIALTGRELLTKYNQIEHMNMQESKVSKVLQSGVISLGFNHYHKTKIEAFLIADDIDLRSLPHFILGPSRRGKTTFLINLIRDMLNAGEHVIVPDFCENCKISRTLKHYFAKYIKEIDCEDMAHPQSMMYNEVPKGEDAFREYANAKTQTSNFTQLIDSINLKNKELQPRMRKFLMAASNVVFIQHGNFNDVKNVLENPIIRHRYMNQLPTHHLERLESDLLHLSELDEVDKETGSIVGTRYNLISGIMDRLNALTENAYLENMLTSDGRYNINLVEEFQKGQLICIKMPDIIFTTDQEKDIFTTYWLTKIWLALKVREYQITDRTKRVKVNLVIDELYQVNQAEQFLETIISRITKLDCKVIITAHHMSQLKYIKDELVNCNPSYTLIQGCTQECFNELKKELMPFTYEDFCVLPKWWALHRIKDDNHYSIFTTQLPSELKPA